MAKISFTKVESILDNTLRNISIDYLKELGAIANLLDYSKPKVSNQTIEQILGRFQIQLKKLKKHDPKLYSRLNISAADRKRLSLPLADLTQADWAKLKELKETIEHLKKELYGEDFPKKEYEQQVESERLKHINKRFNIRDGWLPLK